MLYDDDDELHVSDKLLLIHSEQLSEGSSIMV